MWKVSASLLALVSCAAGLNILLTNDDSWASANIRFVFLFYTDPATKLIRGCA